MKRLLLTDITQPHIVSELQHHFYKPQPLVSQQQNSYLCPRPPTQQMPLLSYWYQKDKEQNQESQLLSQSEIEEPQFNFSRIRTFSENNFKLEEPTYLQYTSLMPKFALNNIFDDEEQCAETKLESCIKSFKNNQEINQQDFEFSFSKVQIRKQEEQMEVDKFEYEDPNHQFLHTIIEEQTENSNNQMIQEYQSVDSIITEDQNDFFQKEGGDQQNINDIIVNNNINSQKSKIIVYQNQQQILNIKQKEKKIKSTIHKLKKKNSTVSSTCSSSSIYKKNKQLEDISQNETTSDEKKLFAFKSQSLIIRKKTPEESLLTDLNAPKSNQMSVGLNQDKRYIGPLSLSERMEKVIRYLNKKRMKHQMKKFCYKCRKQVAEKRLRIKGRFVTKQQAFDILGMTSDDLKGNEIIQSLMEKQGGAENSSKIQLNSLVESDNGKKQIKIRNFQALIDDNYTHNTGQTNKIFGSVIQSQGIQFQTSNPLVKQESINEEELIKQISLNLRISTTKTDDINGDQSHNNHVSKVMISNFQGCGSQNFNSILSIEECLNKSLNNLRMNYHFSNYKVFVQPLFKIEKEPFPRSSC